MNPMLMYAKIPMSFLNLYRRRSAGGNYKFAIAFAMFGILVVNVWSLLLIISVLNHGWLVTRPRISGIEFVGLAVGALIAELVFVNAVLDKTRHDATFAKHLKTADPKISIWYAAISVVVLFVATLLAAII